MDRLLHQWKIHIERRSLAGVALHPDLSRMLLTEYLSSANIRLIA